MNAMVVEIMFAGILPSPIKNVNIDKRLKSSRVLKDPTSMKRNLAPVGIDNNFIYLGYNTIDERYGEVLWMIR